MRIQILDRAELDLVAGFHFYEDQKIGLGSYFLANLFSDIESLRIFGGIHRQACKGYYRLLSGRFPFAIFYKVRGKVVYIHAVLDCRRDPAWIRRRLK